MLQYDEKSAIHDLIRAIEEMKNNVNVETKIGARTWIMLTAAQGDFLNLLDVEARNV